MQNTIKYITFLAVVIGLFITIDRYLSFLNKQQKDLAIDACFQASGTYEYASVSKGIRTTAPQKEYYRICLTDKGYLTTWK